MLSHSRLQSIILTSRIAEAERFYTDVLGLQLRRQSNGHLVFDVGGSEHAGPRAVNSAFRPYGYGICSR